MVRSADSGASVPGFEYQLCRLVAVCLERVIEPLCDSMSSSMNGDNDSDFRAIWLTIKLIHKAQLVQNVKCLLF